MKCWIDEIFVEIAEFEVHGLEYRLRESGAADIGPTRGPVAVFAHVERLKKRAEAIQMNPSRGWKA